MELFGFEFKRKDPVALEQLPSFTPKQTDDGALTVSSAGAGAYGTYVDLEGSVRTEAELVTKYRQMVQFPECDSAVDEIVNEMISVGEDKIVDINLEDDTLKQINFMSDPVKKAVQAEFKNILRLLEFNKYAYEIGRKWYIDGRLYYHAVIDPKTPQAGIQELRYIDPRKIRKVREVQRKRIPVPIQVGDATLPKTVNEYFIYNDRGFSATARPAGSTATTGGTTGLKIAKDSIIHCVSGITDPNGTLVLSYLHKAIRVLNQLKTLEDAVVIYRLSRAPERRIWYIDVGNLPKMKAEQYVRDIMVKHKNRLVYDAATGEIRDDRKFMTLLEDYWLPRMEGGRGTEVTTLPGGQNLGQMDDVLYFQKKFLQALNVPVSRLNTDALFSIGRATEITRDELKFSIFIDRLRLKFSDLFMQVLEKQLVLKQIMTIEQWKVIAPYIRFTFARNIYFTELKNAEIMANRIELARNYQDMAGKYVSHLDIRKNILKQTDDEIAVNDAQIAAENKTGDPRWLNPAIEQNLQMMQQQQMMAAQLQAMQNGQMVMGPDGSAQPAGGGAGGQSSGGGKVPETEDEKMRSKLEQVRQAEITIKQIKNKEGGRSPQDQQKYKKAVQIIAKNKDLIKQRGGAGISALKDQEKKDK